MRRGIALVVALALQMALGIRFGAGAKTELTLNGVALRTEAERAQMTCPPPPQSCAGMLTVFSLAAAASLLFLYAMSKNRLLPQ
jgi:hypothetical protein